MTDENPFLEQFAVGNHTTFRGIVHALPSESLLFRAGTREEVE